MDAVALLKAMRDAAPHLTPNLTLDGERLRMGLYDPERERCYSGTLDEADAERSPVDLAAEVAAAAQEGASP